MTEPTFCSGMAEVASRYDGFLVDQWGVLHDGTAPYPGAIACLERLRAAGKRVVLLSNSGRRVEINRARLARLGFSGHLFEALITSGEVAWRALKDRSDPAFAGLGRRCLLWSETGDRSIADGLDLELVESVDEADFVFLTGTPKGSALEDFAPGLQQALARGLPLVCSNPDVVVVGAEGLAMAPGAVAQHYAALGGRVALTGKPHPPIYRLCLELLAPLPAGRILAVGDSLEHDVAGGAAAGLDTALVMGGIHAASFDLAHGRQANWPALERLARRHGALPRWVLVDHVNRDLGPAPQSGVPLVLATEPLEPARDVLGTCSEHRPGPGRGRGGFRYRPTISAAPRVRPLAGPRTGLAANSGAALTHHDLRPARSIRCARTKRQTY